MVTEDLAETSRRDLLGRIALGLGVLACNPALGDHSRRVAAAAIDRATYVAVETSSLTGLSRARFVSDDGGPMGSVPLDFRAHGLARSGAWLAVFPRRPGTRIALVNLATLDVTAVIDAPPGRHFYGHGAFTGDGRHLLVTENDLETLAGGVGLYEIAAPVRRVGTFALPGAGPHDIRRVGDADRFQIALGGLMTHPDYGRTPLNGSDFRSDVVTLDLRSGRHDAIGHWERGEGTSLRHLAQDDRGRLYVGGQRIGDPDRGHVLWLVENGVVRPLDAGRHLGGYVSSVAASGGRAIVTSKVTGQVLHLDGARLIAREQIDGASAAAVMPNGHAVSGFARLRLGRAEHAPSPLHEYDNHGLALVNVRAGTAPIIPTPTSVNEQDHT